MKQQKPAEKPVIRSERGDLIARSIERHSRKETRPQGRYEWQKAEVKHVR